MQCWFAPEYILITVAVDGEQGRAGANHGSVLYRQGTAESLGLPPCSHMTLCGRRFGRVWLNPQERHARQTGEQPLIWFLLGTAFPFTGPALLAIPSIQHGGCLWEGIGGLRLHLLMEIALTFIFICWPDCYPVPEAECGYTFLLKLACLV